MTVVVGRMETSTASGDAATVMGDSMDEDMDRCSAGELIARSGEEFLPDDCLLHVSGDCWLRVLCPPAH